MRNLTTTEVGQVSGGDWSLSFDLKIVSGEISGEATLPEIIDSAASGISDAYWGARDAMADFYEWAANGWNYSMACSYRYY